MDAINAAIQNQGLLYKKDPEDVISPEYRRMDRKMAEMKGKAVSEKEFIQALYQRAEERYRTLTVKDALYKTRKDSGIRQGIIQKADSEDLFMQESHGRETAKRKLYGDAQTD